MDLDPDNLKKNALTLTYQSIIGIGVVFVALLTTLPAAWEVEALRRPFVLYLSAVYFGLISSVVLMLFMVVHKDFSRVQRAATGNMCVFGLAVFALSSVAFIGYLVDLTK